MLQIRNSITKIILILPLFFSAFTSAQAQDVPSRKCLIDEKAPTFSHQLTDDGELDVLLKAMTDIKVTVKPRVFEESKIDFKVDYAGKLKSGHIQWALDIFENLSQFQKSDGPLIDVDGLQEIGGVGFFLEKGAILLPKTNSSILNAESLGDPKFLTKILKKTTVTAKSGEKRIVETNKKFKFGPFNFGDITSEIKFSDYDLTKSEGDLPLTTIKQILIEDFDKNLGLPDKVVMASASKISQVAKGMTVFYKIYNVGEDDSLMVIYRIGAINLKELPLVPMWIMKKATHSQFYDDVAELGQQVRQHFQKEE